MNHMIYKTLVITSPEMLPKSKNLTKKERNFQKQIRLTYTGDL